jgi:hypothetical protein
VTFLFKKTIPQELRPLLNLVGPSFFKAIPWLEMARESGVIFSNMTSKDRSREMKVLNHMKNLLPMVRFGWTMEEHLKTVQKPFLPAEAGERILEFYFKQLENPEGLFLDLRLDRWFFKDGVGYFFPNRIWVKLDDHFRRSLLSLYKGYYEENTSLFEEGLAGVGLIREDFSVTERMEIQKIFLDHFGPGDQTEIVFSTSHFLTSFERIFRFILDKNLSISGQFLHLGICLSTLYLALEELANPLNVRRAYMQAKGNIGN